MNLTQKMVSKLGTGENILTRKIRFIKNTLTLTKILIGRVNITMIPVKI